MLSNTLLHRVRAYNPSFLSRFASTHPKPRAPFPPEDERPPLPESRWRRLKRERRAQPTPSNRTQHDYDRDRRFDLTTALSHVRHSQWAGFDETLELVFRLNVDPRHAHHNLRGVITLPHGTGRKDEVVVFAEDDDAQLAKQEGADMVGGGELIDMLQREKGKPVKKFAFAISMHHLLPTVAAKLGRILGPRGLMPNAKLGTVVADGEQLVEKLRSMQKGLLAYRIDRHGNMHLNVGKMSFDDHQLIENVHEAFRSVSAIRPADVKKKFMEKVIICSSMGPAVQVDTNQLARGAFA